MIIFVDIDETICYNIDNPDKARDYNLSVPNRENIQLINRLFDEGYQIIYWTARGSGTGIDWRSTTEHQLKEWGVKYHELKLGKPVYDLFICDKAISSLNMEENLKTFLRERDINV